MESRPITDYIYFGTALRFLQDAEEGTGVHDKAQILENINNFLCDLEIFELPVTNRAAYKLIEFRDKLGSSDADSKLTHGEARELKTTMNDLRKTLFAEAKGNVAFIVTDKRIDVNKLLSDVPALFVPGTFESFPEIAKYDFIEAGKCIAFERPTAGAFHILRGTEAIIRHFYCSIVKIRRVQPLNWGPMVRSLRERKSKPPPDVLLDDLDRIRENYRNPTQHPDLVYDIHEVQGLFPICIDVASRMVNHLRDRT